MSLESRETFHGLENAVTSAAEDSHYTDLQKHEKRFLAQKSHF